MAAGAEGLDLAGTVTWKELLAETEQLVRAMPLETAPNEARWIIEQAAGDRLEAVADELATQRGVAHLDAMVARRAVGEPLQYVLGRWAFRTLDLFVDRRVLIPRPETEVVAGLVIDEIRRRGPRAKVVDLGTGSGAIALSVAAECPGTEVVAVEQNPAAVEVARANTAGLGRRGAAVTLLEGSWFEPLPADLKGTVDVIVSNPPYVRDDDSLPQEVEQWEPADALRAGSDGLDDLRVIIAGAGEWLSSDGLLVCEVDPRQSEAVVELASATGFVDARVEPDLAGRPRVLVARRG